MRVRHSSVPDYISIWFKSVLSLKYSFQKGFIFVKCESQVSLVHVDNSLLLNNKEGKKLCVSN